MSTFDFDLFSNAGRQAREELFLKGKKFSGVRTKPRRAADLEMLARRAAERIRKYPPSLAGSVLTLPYFSQE